MVHHQMLPSPIKYLDNKYCRHSAQRAPQGVKAAGVRGPHCQPKPSRGISEGGRDSGVTDGGGIGIHVGPILTVRAPMVPGREDVDHDRVGKGGAVPNGLRPGDR